VESAIPKIRQCKTADEVFAVTNALLTQVQNISSAVRTMSGPKPIRSASDLGAWVHELKAVTNLQSANESTELLATLFAWLRAAGRKLDDIGRRD
jgi:alpha-beta hydrolase superfamily lysophospholipase